MIGLQIGAFILEMTMVVWFIRCKRIIKEGNRKMRGIKKIIIGVATVLLLNLIEYYGAAEPPVRCGESHLSGLTEPLRSL